MKRFLVVGLLLIGTALIMQGCSRTESTEIKGSDTMVNLGQAWAEAFRAEHPDTNISVTGGGSGVGIAALINGDTDIAQSSREMKDEEKEQARKAGLDPQEFIVAQDGLSVIVNPGNPVSRLTIDQLSDIYTGRITNWGQLGGPDQRMVVLSRDRSSGTHVFFLDHVVRRGDSKSTEEYANTVLMQIASQSIADEVARNASAIGYVGMGYVDAAKHKAVAIAANEQSQFVEPSSDNVLNGSYPIARPLYMYTPAIPEGTVKEFIDFALSDEGQKIVEAQEFVPVKAR